MPAATPSFRPAGRTRRLLTLVLLSTGLAACACPPVIERYGTPEETLATWQAQLCADDAPGEYACLAASFKRAMQGFENYHAARTALVEEHPATAWLLSRADLAEHVVELSYSPDGELAAMVLEAGSERLSVLFEREAWLTIGWADGSQQAVRQNSPLPDLLGAQDGRQWLLIERPELSRGRLAELRSLHLDPRWMIADLAGLAGGSTGALIP